MADIEDKIFNVFIAATIICAVVLTGFLVYCVVNLCNNQIGNKAQSYESKYIESIHQASYDAVTTIPATRVDNDLLLEVTTQNINENQKQVLIKVSNAPDSGRDPYSTETTLIKIR